jgi:Holliday junction DNA helicase RuvA
MIAKLTGTLDSATETHAVIDCHGVGYLVQCGARTLARLGRPGDPVTLFIETRQREDGVFLYGFPDGAERDWFRLLTTVQGVGAKVALAVLSVVDPQQLMLAIAAQDKAPLTRADGVGPKLAQRIVNELKDKAGEIALGPAGISVQPVAGAAPAGDGAQDAVSALVNLGYGRAEAFAAVAAARKQNGGADVSGLIRGALKELAR